MTNTVLEYFEEYRQKISEVERLENKERELGLEVDKIRRMRGQLRQDLLSMQRLITVMIENDWDPVEAKLKTESEERQRSFWDVRSDAEQISGKIASQLGVTLTGALGATGATGILGATGANGGAGYAYGAYGNMGVAGGSSYSVGKYALSSATTITTASGNYSCTPMGASGDAGSYS